MAAVSREGSVTQLDHATELPAGCTSRCASSCPQPSRRRPVALAKKPVARRSRVLATLVDAGAELVLAGHIHQAAISERHEFEVVTGDIRGVTVSIAPGLGQPRPDRRGEARGLHVYRCEAEALTIETYIWREDDWGLTAIRRFPRGHGPLAAQPAPT